MAACCTRGMFPRAMTGPGSVTVKLVVNNVVKLVAVKVWVPSCSSLIGMATGRAADASAMKNAKSNASFVVVWPFDAARDGGGGDCSGIGVEITKLSETSDAHFARQAVSARGRSSVPCESPQ